MKDDTEATSIPPHVRAAADRDTRLDPVDHFEATQPGGLVPPPPPTVPRPVSRPEPGDVPVPALTERDRGPLFPGGEPADRRTQVDLPPPSTGGRPRTLPPLPPVPPQEHVVVYPAADVPTTPPGAGGVTGTSPPAVKARLPRAHGWPFLPLGPLLVVTVGLAVAIAIGGVGLDQLARAGEDHAAARAELLAVTVAARLAVLPGEQRLEATHRAATRSAAQILIASPAGELLYDATLGAPDAVSLRTMLGTGHGAAEMRTGRARYAVRAIGPPGDPAAPRLVVLVPEPRAVTGRGAFLTALGALVVLFLGVAAVVAYAVSRDVTRDVEFVADRVRTMAQIRAEPTGELVPVRSLDEVGVLTVTFNKLVGRFGTSSVEYRQDLARASAADRERAAFLAAVSHELRSPLNAILGFADILMEEVDGPLSPSAKEEVEQIRGSGAHLLALINDILEFSALESGQLRLARSRVDVLALAAEVVREARGLVGDRPLVVRIEGEPLVARVDARRVRQILGNLINNAIKFTQRGHVVIRVGRDGSFVVLRVEDTGPGISAQERAIIFEEFRQARSERPRRRGTGLGLAITRRLVMLHHGTIKVDSELGRGSMFEVRLPIGNVDAPPSRRLERDANGDIVNPSLPPPPRMPAEVPGAGRRRA